MSAAKVHVRRAKRFKLSVGDLVMIEHAQVPEGVVAAVVEAPEGHAVVRRYNAKTNGWRPARRLPLHRIVQVAPMDDPGVRAAMGAMGQLGLGGRS